MVIYHSYREAKPQRFSSLVSHVDFLGPPESAFEDLRSQTQELFPPLEGLQFLEGYSGHFSLPSGTSYPGETLRLGMLMVWVGTVGPRILVRGYWALSRTVTYSTCSRLNLLRPVGSGFPSSTQESLPDRGFLFHGFGLCRLRGSANMKWKIIETGIHNF